MGVPTDTTVDAFGNTATVVEHPSATTTATTSYGYDKADRLTALIDAGPNVTLLGYDLAGRKTTMVDPDAGTSSYTYDPDGNLATQTNALGQQLFYTYDSLDRLTDTRQDTPGTGQLVARNTWYGAPYLGLLRSATSYDGANAYVETILAYDARDRPTSRQWTIPAAATGVAGTYKMAYTYNPADQPTSVTYPGGPNGSLGETVSTGYDRVGSPVTLTGSASYVSASGYDANRQLVSQTLGAAGANIITRTLGYQAGTNRLVTLKAGNGTSATNRQNLVYGYDVGGNVTSIVDGGNASQKQCFTYDPLDRLTRAFTADSTCGTYDPTRGADPYDQAFTYDAVGNFLTAAGRTYTYSDPAHPHAPTQAGTDAFSYDAGGAQNIRMVGGIGAFLGYDALRRLSWHASSSGISSYVYDTAGNRLIRSDTDGTNITLYLAGGSYQATSSNGATPTTLTYYTLGSQRVAYRDGTTLSFLLADQQGSTVTTTNATGTSPKYQRYYPYGALRPDPGPLTINEKHLGQPHDTATGLNQYGARYYDPALARFTSPDPIATPTRPQSLNPYTNALNNPTTLTDPSGLAPYCNMYAGVCFDDGTGPPADAKIVGGGSHAGYGSHENDRGNNCGGCTITAAERQREIRNDRTRGFGQRIFDGCHGFGMTALSQSLCEAQYGYTYDGSLPMGGLDDLVGGAWNSVADTLNLALDPLGAPLPTAPRGTQLAGLGELVGYWAQGKIAIRLATAARAARATRAATADDALLSGVLRDAAKGKGNFGLGGATQAQARTAGEARVGKGYSVASDGKTLISTDGLRQFRPPSYKPNLGSWQADFEERLVPQGQWQSNGHLDILDIP